MRHLTSTVTACIFLEPAKLRSNRPNRDWLFLCITVKTLKSDEASSAFFLLSKVWFRGGAFQIQSDHLRPSVIKYRKVKSYWCDFSADRSVFSTCPCCRCCWVGGRRSATVWSCPWRTWSSVWVCPQILNMRWVSLLPYSYTEINIAQYSSGGFKWNCSSISFAVWCATKRHFSRFSPFF